MATGTCCSLVILIALLHCTNGFFIVSSRCAATEKWSWQRLAGTTEQELAPVLGELLPAEEAKKELLSLIPKMTGPAKQHLDDRERVGLLLRSMEVEFEPIRTLDFMNFATSGKWHLLFSTTRLGAFDPRLRVMEFAQEIVPGAEEHSAEEEAPASAVGEADVVVKWSLPGEPGVYGDFEIGASYNINERGHAVMKLREHRLTPLGEKMPKDAVALVSLLQRAIPPEIFDPDGSIEETTYVDSDVRITKLHVGKFVGARHIYIRDPKILFQ